MQTERIGKAPAAPVRSTRGRKSAAQLSEIQLLAEISAKLDRVIAVLAAQGKDRDKQVDILAASGCDSNFIGVVVGMTGGAVRTYLSRRRGKASREVVTELTDDSTA